MGKTPRTDFLLVMGDFNAKIGQSDVVSRSVEGLDWEKGMIEEIG